MVELHSERGGVEQDGGKDGVFTEGRGGKRPQAILERVLWNVSPDRLGIEGVLYAVPLQRISSAFANIFKISSAFANIFEISSAFANLFEISPGFCLRHNLGRMLHPRFGR